MDIAKQAPANGDSKRCELLSPSKAPSPNFVAALPTQAAVVGKKPVDVQELAIASNCSQTEKSITALQALRAVKLSVAPKAPVSALPGKTPKARAFTPENVSCAVQNCGHSAVSDISRHPMVPSLTQNIRPAAAITTLPTENQSGLDPLSMCHPSALSDPEANSDVSASVRAITSAPKASTVQSESINKQVNEKPYQIDTQLTIDATGKAVNYLNATPTQTFEKPVLSLAAAKAVRQLNSTQPSLSQAGNHASPITVSSTTAPVLPSAGGPSLRLPSGRSTGGGLYGLRSTRLTSQIASKATSKAAAVTQLQTSSPNVVAPPVSSAVARAPPLPGVVEQECDTPLPETTQVSALSDSSVLNGGSTASTESSTAGERNAARFNGKRDGDKPLWKRTLPGMVKRAPRLFEKEVTRVSRPVSAASTISKTKRSLTNFDETLSLAPSTEDDSTRASLSSRGSIMTRLGESLSRPSSSTYTSYTSPLVGTDEPKILSTTVMRSLETSSTASQPPTAELPSFHTRTASQEVSEDGVLPAPFESMPTELAEHTQPFLSHDQPSAPSTPPATFLEQQRRDFTQMQFASPQSPSAPPPPRRPSLKPRMPLTLAPPPKILCSVLVADFLPAASDDVSEPLLPPPPRLTRTKFTDIPLMADAACEGPEKQAALPIPPLPPQAPKAPPETPAFPKITQPPKVMKEELPFLFEQMPEIVDKDSVPAPHNFLTKHLFMRGSLPRLTVFGYICANVPGTRMEQWTAALQTINGQRGTTTKEEVNLLNRGFAMAGHPLLNVGALFAYAGSCLLPNSQIAARRAGVPRLHLKGITNSKPMLKATDPALQLSYPKFDPDYDVENADDSEEYEDISDYRRKRAWRKFRFWFSWCGGGEKESEWDEHDRVRASALLLGGLLFAGSIMLFKLGRIQSKHVQMSYGLIEVFFIVAAISSVLFGLLLSRKALAPRNRTDYAAVGNVIRSYHAKQRRKVHFEDSV